MAVASPSRASASATASVGRQSTWWCGSWGSPACVSLAAACVSAAAVMVPPFKASVFASTAMPRVDSLGQTTVWAKVSAGVPVPPS